MSYLRALPLFAFMLVLVNLFAFAAPAAFEGVWFAVPLVSGATWKMTGGHVLLAISVVLLYVELLKATRSGSISILDHVLSTLVFVIFLLEFLLVAPMGNAVVFLIMLMTAADVVGGFTVTISTARRDFGGSPFEE